MFTILDQWLARLFGASRRDRSVPLLAQRAYYGHDDLDLQQVGAYDRSFDFDDQPSPYQPYVRLPRSRDIIVDQPAPAAPGAAEREAAASQKSQQMLRGDWEPESAAEPTPEVWSADPNRVRFTRTPESYIQRRRDEEEAKARALEEESRRVAEAARLRAEEEARRIEEDARRMEEAKLAIARAMRTGSQDESDDGPRVRFSRTPDAVFLARSRAKNPQPEPEVAPEAAAEPAPEPAVEPAVEAAAEPVAESLPQAAAEPTPAPAAPVQTAEPPAFAPFTAMGARFALQVGYGAQVRVAATPAPVPAAPVTPVVPQQAEPAAVAAPAEPDDAEAQDAKPAKIRVRVKAAGQPAPEETSREPAKEPTAPKMVIVGRPAPTPRGGFLQRIDPTGEDYDPIEIDMLAEPPAPTYEESEDEVLEVNADALEKTLEDFGVRGDVLNAHPGPVVTLYEFEPAPGIKSSRVIGLADDIARSMSAVSARVAVVPGRNAIGIELPNPRRETVYLRELIASPDFSDSKHRLAIALGKTIGGEPVIVDLAKMPHLLVAGTTGSGKSVAINTMILSLLYRLKPQECRLIMVDPKMLELSVYDGIPHLLTPVVTDPKKAVVALKWAVREMEDRYKKMSKLGVRNIDGFNARVTEATAKGEVITRTVQTGFDRETGEAIYEQEQMDLSTLPYIVVIVDEMADLMMVAGKEIEGAIQRLAQMARAAGIHLIMATQRPSVDVITGTIKANFPTRISFQVTSKIDSRTILGEMGAEQLLGQGDMLYMAGGGRIVRVHGPFVSDTEVERVVAHLKTQGAPEYLDGVTAEDDGDDEDAAPLPVGDEDGADLYDRAVAVVLRDKKCSTSYVQRRLQVGYNKAASLVERMEKEGVVGPANHAGKRQILVGGGVDRGAFDLAD
ncbi:DNA segregation ATPase FtsK/SpoIIIE-like protein [Rhodoblastus acidophilus]|uniref:DNA translocase FtsK n=1 Tax=Rhodoblastus acidophilus TaxID=1074 RepID=UPI002224EF4A|nr:DNA translocase FtsK [Rhodoblastus acidophilus]MCW2284802.1 DNA segregation ATPase FtsK/SpoIIIE-like protein [Rhodoblastus acidophilus]MCW2333755.1 DNA segregation ATPase FtsK/SpoIIIE-like protein [Rhodoblastus acidophilus]